MSKKVKIILSILIGLIGFWGYFYWKFRDINFNSTDLSYGLGAIPDPYSEGPYGEKSQKKLLAEIMGLEKLPKFEDFPATEFSNNKNIVVDINSDPIGRTYRSAIRYSVERLGINFAGKYSVATWGCGTGCQDGVIVDADSGRIYRLPGIPMINGYEVKKDSRLFVQNPITVGSGWMNDWFKMRYWEWTGNSFKLLGTYQVDLAKREIVEVAY